MRISDWSSDVCSSYLASLRRGGTATILGMMPLSEKVGLSAMDLLSGKKLQGAIMGGNRFPVDIPRLVDFYLRVLLVLDSFVTETIPLAQINEGFDKMKTGEDRKSNRLNSSNSSDSRM